VCKGWHRCARILVFVCVAIVPVPPIGYPSSVLAQTGHEQEHALPDATGPETTLRGFGAVEWAASQLRDVPNSFSLGQLSLFVSSNLSERVSVLAEVVLEGQGSANTQVATDLERLQLTFRLNDFLHVSTGRYHSGIGFYNAAFHHGTYFEIPIGRPHVFRFEDDGGALPIHELGVSTRGVVPHTGSSLRYVAEVGNGRPWTPAADGDTSERPPDSNDAKSTNLGVSYRPDRWRGFEAGGSYYRDTIRQTATNTVDQNIAAIYAVYRTPSTELMVEWLRLMHVTDDRSRYRNDGGYAQLSRAWGKLRPYYRFDRLAINAATPFIGPLGSFKAHIAGLRVDPMKWLGLKMQYERTDESGQFGVNGVRTQLVFMF
jgi:hypothetical protein